MPGLRTRLARVTARVSVLQTRSDRVVFEPGVLAFGMPILTAVPGASVHVGKSVRLVSSSRMTPLGVNHPVLIRALRDGATIRIGDETGISGATICALGSITIGRRCLLGANVMIVDSDFHPVHEPTERWSADAPPFRDEDAVVIGDHVFIGTGSLVIKGVHIGDNSVVGAGSVVTSDVPPDTIVAGNPARVIGAVGIPHAEASAPRSVMKEPSRKKILVHRSRRVNGAPEARP